MKRTIHKNLAVAAVLVSQQLVLPVVMGIVLPVTLSSEALAQRGGGRVRQQPTNRNTMNRDRVNSGRVNSGRPTQQSENLPDGGDRPRQGGERTNVINRGDVNINRNTVNINNRTYNRVNRNSYNINVRRSVYVGRPGWRTYGWYWGPYRVHADYAWLSFLIAALLIGSYTSNNTTVYVYTIEEDGIEKEYHINEDGEILSVEVVD